MASMSIRDAQIKRQPTQADTAMQSPAMAALKNWTTPAGQAPAAQAAPTTPPPAPGPPQVQAATVDTSKADEVYTQMMDQQNQMWGNTQQMIQQNFSGQLRRNSENAARMGLQAGGASYLSGNRTALNNAANNAMQMQNQAWTQQAGIMGQQVGMYGNAAQANASAQNQANQANWNRQNQLDDAKTAAQATQNANQATASVAQVKTDFEYLFNKNNYKAGEGQFRSLLQKYEAAMSTGNPQEQQAAYQALMAYVTPFQQARERWLSEGGSKQTSFENYYNTWKGKGRGW